MKISELILGLLELWKKHPIPTYGTRHYHKCTGFGLWIAFAGEFQIGDNIKPLDPKSVASQVFYGKKKHRLVHMSNGHSLVYNQLYPFEGLQNYTSGIIHHVRLTGLITLILIASFFFFFLFIIHS